MARCHTCSQIWPTHLSEDTLLCLRPSHSAVMPSVVNMPKPRLLTPQRRLLSKLPGTSNDRFQECDIACYHTAQKRAEVNSPQGSNAAVLDPLAERIDALDGEGAPDATTTVFVQSTERVAVQAAATEIPMVRKCEMARYHTTTNMGRRLT